MNLSLGSVGVSVCVCVRVIVFVCERDLKKNFLLLTEMLSMCNKLYLIKNLYLLTECV